MKKVTSLLLSLIVLASAVLPFTAFAETKKEALTRQVNEDIAGQVEFLNITPSLDAAVDAYTLFRADESKKDVFLAELNQNLTDNSGKIVVSGRQDAVVYACVINILTLFGENVESYNGVNIKADFESLADKTVSNPYYYRVVTEACKNIGNTTLGHHFVDELIANYYTLGQGMDYYGFSCDNTAAFLASIAPYKEDYAVYVEDAKTVINGFTTDEGCFYDSVYTDVSPDSTAMAMLAFASIGEHKTAKTLYDCLMNGFESEAHNGVIMAYGFENAYTTKEALMALTYFEPSLAVDDEPLVENTNNQNVTQTASKENNSDDNTVRSPQTGAGITFGFAAMSIGAALLIGAKRKEN